MSKFDVKQISEGFYAINDEGNSSFYVVEGEKRAAVIDTGVTRGEKIMPVIRGVTQKPLILVVTHGHIDHMYHMDEFDRVFLCHEELKLSDAAKMFMSGGRNLDWEGVLDMHTGDIIDLGGDTLVVCQLAGHSPGSVILYDKARELLFTGDAIGSGCGVWMQCDTSISLDVFYESLCAPSSGWLTEAEG